MRGLKIDELQHRENPSNGKVVVKWEQRRIIYDNML
jgi:hypothetical protein